MASKGAPIDKRLTNVVKTNAGIFHFPIHIPEVFPSQLDLFKRNL